MNPSYKLKDLTDLLNAITPPIGIVVTVIITVVALAGYLLQARYIGWRALSLLAKSIRIWEPYKKPGFWNAVGRFLKSLKILAVDIGRSHVKKQRVEFARVYIEHRILAYPSHPLSAYTRKEHREAKKWADTCKVTVDSKISEVERDNKEQCNHNTTELETYYWRIRHWKADQQRLQERLISGKDSGKKLELDIQNVFEMRDEARATQIKSYLKLRSEFDSSSVADTSFELRVRFMDGFLLPLFLVAGMLDRFEEDWQKVISNYNFRLGDPEEAERTFLWDCWLMWGPSVPLCRCQQWRSDRGIFFQYGYGDENNSLPVYAPVNAGEVTPRDDIINAIRRRCEEDIDQSRDSYPHLRTGLVVSICHRESLESTDIVRSQQGLLKDKESVDYLLRYENKEAYKEAGSTNSNEDYYSAYVWAMFYFLKEAVPLPTDWYAAMKQIHDLQGEAKGELWKRLIPIFVHGNIVNPVCYKSAKSMLVQKVMGFVRNLPQNGNASGKLVFLCALDDSGCGSSLETAPASQTIRHMLCDALNKTAFQDLKSRIIVHEYDKVQLNGRAPIEGLNSCYLHKHVEDFYDSCERKI